MDYHCLFTYQFPNGQLLLEGRAAQDGRGLGADRDPGQGDPDEVP